jgi:hypothetical protein
LITLSWWRLTNGSPIMHYEKPLFISSSDVHYHQWTKTSSIYKNDPLFTSESKLCILSFQFFNLDDHLHLMSSSHELHEFFILDASPWFALNTHIDIPNT